MEYENAQEMSANYDYMRADKLSNIESQIASMAYKLENVFSYTLAAIILSSIAIVGIIMLGCVLLKEVK